LKKLRTSLSAAELFPQVAVTLRWSGPIFQFTKSCVCSSSKQCCQIYNTETFNKFGIIHRSISSFWN